MAKDLEQEIQALWAAINEIRQRLDDEDEMLMETLPMPRRRSRPMRYKEPKKHERKPYNPTP